MQSKEILGSILCWGSSESQACKFPSCFLTVPQPSRAKVNEIADAGQKQIIKKFCPDFTTYYNNSIHWLVDLVEMKPDHCFLLFGQQQNFHLDLSRN